MPGAGAGQRRALACGGGWACGTSCSLLPVVSSCCRSWVLPPREFLLPVVAVAARRVLAGSWLLLLVVAVAVGRGCCCPPSSCCRSFSTPVLLSQHRAREAEVTNGSENCLTSSNSGNGNAIGEAVTQEGQRKLATGSETRDGQRGDHSEIRRSVLLALSDPEIDGIVNLMNTPGGSAQGADSMASFFSKSAKTKALYTFAESEMCSGRLLPRRTFSRDIRPARCPDRLHRRDHGALRPAQDVPGSGYHPNRIPRR